MRKAGHAGRQQQASQAWQQSCYKPWHGQRLRIMGDGFQWRASG
jgi:hypothetical protein